MPPETTPRAPGSLTVPPLFGWEEIATVLVLLVALGVAFLLIATSRAGTAERSEWQAWLDSRSGGRQARGTEAQGGAARPVVPRAVGGAAALESERPDV